MTDQDPRNPRPGDRASTSVVCPHCHSARVFVGAVFEQFIYYRCDDCRKIWSSERQLIPPRE